MSWLDRSRPWAVRSFRVLFGGFAVGVALVVAGCGFHPLYGGGDGDRAAALELAKVEIGTLPNREGHKLRNLLIDRFHADGRSREPRYRLEVSLNASDQKIGVSKDATATRAQWYLTAVYTLSDRASGKPLFKGHSRSITGYALPQAQFGYLSNQLAAYDEGLEQLSNDITTVIGMYLNREPELPTAAGVAK
ncbi:LPS-assembly lipoprotein [uncultured Gammaproteobacteria bacterium]